MSSVPLAATSRTYLDFLEARSEVAEAEPQEERMHPEFKAWINAICNPATTTEAARTQNFQELAHLAARSRTGVFSFLADLVEQADADGCPLLRRRQENGESYRDAIGYHGLR